MLEEPLQDRPVAAGERGRQPRLFYGYWLIGAAFVAQFVAVGAIVYVMGPFLAPMTEELGWTRAEYTIPRSLGQFLMAVTGFVIGTHVDRYGARRLMLIGVTLLAGSLFAMGSIDTLWQWIVLNGILATVGAGLMGNLVVNVTLAKWFVELRGRAIAFSAMGVSFAGVLLTPTMTMVIDTWGWRAGWQVLGVGRLCSLTPLRSSCVARLKTTGSTQTGSRMRKWRRGLPDARGSTTRARSRAHRPCGPAHSTFWSSRSGYRSST